MIDQTVFNNREDTVFLRALVDAMTVAPELYMVEDLLLTLKDQADYLLGRIGVHLKETVMKRKLP